MRQIVAGRGDVGACSNRGEKAEDNEEERQRFGNSSRKQNSNIQIHKRPFSGAHGKMAVGMRLFPDNSGTDRRRFVCPFVSGDRQSHCVSFLPVILPAHTVLLFRPPRKRGGNPPRKTAHSRQLAYIPVTAPNQLVTIAMGPPAAMTPATRQLIDQAPIKPAAIAPRPTTAPWIMSVPTPSVTNALLLVLVFTICVFFISGLLKKSNVLNF